jgi:hypothetical protein
MLEKMGHRYEDNFIMDLENKNVCELVLNGKISWWQSKMNFWNSQKQT